MHSSSFRPFVRRIGSSLVALSILSVVSAAQDKGGPPPRDAAADREAVKRAVLDYVEGFYEGDSAKFVRSVHSSLAKYGFGWNKESGKYGGGGMNLGDALKTIAGIKKRGGMSPQTPKDVVVFDVLDQTASAKLTASWGVDYLLLGRYDGKWMVSHILWQSPPPSSAVGTR